MRRLLLAAALVASSAVLAPAALAADPITHSGRVLISTEGDVVVPAGEQADVVIVVNGTARIAGAVNTLVVVDGAASLEGARLETVVAVRSSVEVLAGTIVQGEIKRLDSTVHQGANAQVMGGITDLSADLLAVGAVLAPALLLIWLGFGLATIAAALIVAALAARQIREAEALISHEPLLTGAVGLLATIVLPVTAIVLMATLIGLPLGFGLLFGVLPLVAFTGYIVAAIWTGEWILRRTSSAPQRQRPYLAAMLGVLTLGALGLVPVLGIVVAIASMLGFGAILRVAFRTARGAPHRLHPAQAPAVAPTGA